METGDAIRLLGLSKKELAVLEALKSGMDTPVKIAAETDISRPAIYAILGHFKKRGFAATHIRNGRKHWSLAPEREIEEVLYDAKRALLNIPEGSEELYGRSDASVIIHRGAEAIRTVLIDLLAAHKTERFYAITGTRATAFWDQLFSPRETNHFNRTLKKNDIIAETILQEGWLEHEARKLGPAWALDFEGRTTRVNVIDPEYFAHGSQIFIFKQSIYLMALGEELVIEIRNSEIQRMLLMFFKFIQDNSQLIDANELLRKVIAEAESKEESAT